jgi:predicted nucleic acid-binding protein
MIMSDKLIEVAIDSSLLVGLIYPNDNWHSRAVELWTAIKTVGHTGIFFDCVATEAVSAATRRLHEKNRLSDINRLLDQLNIYVPLESITWILPDVPRLYPEVLNLMQSSDGALNFNDALIALACREREIPAIASFDADFDQVDWLRRLALPDDLSQCM